MKVGVQQAGWWTTDCLVARNRVRESLRDLRGAQEGVRQEIRQRYLGERRKIREVCEDSKRKWKRKLEGDVMAIKTEEEFWKFVNKGKRCRRWGGGNIGR